jgi:hypothetical protein
MKLRILAVSLAALLSSSDALSTRKEDKGRRASKVKKQPVQDIAAKGSDFKDRAMEEKTNYKVSGIVGSTERDNEKANYKVSGLVGSTARDNQRADKKKKEAEKEKKIKVLGSTENEAGAYELKPKHGNEDKKVDEATPTHNSIGLNIVGGQQSSIGEFPYYGTLRN